MEKKGAGGREIHPVIKSNLPWLVSVNSLAGADCAFRWVVWFPSAGVWSAVGEVAKVIGGRGVFCWG